MFSRKSIANTQLQFTLRSFLLITILLGVSPWIWSRFRKWRSAQLWREVESARAQRDVTQRNWKITFERFIQGVRTQTDHALASEEYFEARNKHEVAVTALLKFYHLEDGQSATVEIRNGEKVLVATGEP